jgi:pimeloyl-ACP methyl ester carboxylesterase
VPETPAASLVLVHGAWAGGWIWERVLPRLAAERVEVVAVDLPSCRPGAGPAAGLQGDEQGVREVLDGVPGTAVLCGHSYGGMVVTGAAAGHPRVRRLIYLCAFMPERGRSLLGLFDGRVPSFWRVRDDLMVERVADDASGTTGELDADAERWLAERRVAQPLRAFTEAPTGVAWETIPSTYVVCTEDMSIPPPLQRSFAAQASETVELATGHHPMLTRPDELAALLANAARSCA